MTYEKRETRKKREKRLEITEKRKREGKVKVKRGGKRRKKDYAARLQNRMDLVLFPNPHPLDPTLTNRKEAARVQGPSKYMK